jgi:hypothetical protein
MIRYWVEKNKKQKTKPKTEALRASRKNGDMQPHKVGDWGGSSRIYQRFGGKRLSGLKDLR